jgi:hypothetical protein
MLPVREVAAVISAAGLFEERIDRGQRLVEAILGLGVAQVDAFHQDFAKRGRLLEDGHDLVDEPVERHEASLAFWPGVRSVRTAGGTSSMTSILSFKTARSETV